MKNRLRNNALSITIAFETTALMWTGGYVLHLPFLMITGAVPLFFFLICLIGAGFYTAGHSASPAVDGFKTGLWISILNLLILGSVLGGVQPGTVVPSAWIWVPGSLVFGSLLVCAFAKAGSLLIQKAEQPVNWLFRFSRIAAGVTLLLILAGGIVTSAQAGLAVTDWPNSYGYNMFLFPLAKMTGGIYYEHSHRLLGSLAGLTTIVLACLIHALSNKTWLKRLSWIAVALVIAQGVMGGLRVTGYFTLSQSPDETAPNLYLAMIHGVTGQLFFGLLTAIAAFTSTAWDNSQAVPHTKARSERVMATILLAMLILQLIFGSIVRHHYGNTILLIHITMAVLILLKAVMCSARAWWGSVHPPLLKRIGGLLGIVVFLQVTLGFAALVGVVSSKNAGEPTAIDILFSTAHQTTGALLFALSLLLLIWTARLLKQSSEPLHSAEPAG